MKKFLQSEIFRKIFFAMLLLAVVPALVLGWMAIEAGNQAGDLSTTLSQTALDAKSKEMLELQAVTTAETIAEFLTEREADLNLLAWLPQTEEAYLNFYQQHIRIIWGMKGGFEYRMKEPLYVEIAWVGADGWERLKVQDGVVLPEADLHHVDEPDTSHYPATDWFAETLGLPEGEIYVGHLNGYYLSQEAYQNGTDYNGIIRFARPVFGEDEAVLGVVTLALDYRHLAQFSTHIVPNEKRYAAEPDVRTGNYAYLIDDRGWTLVHPNQFYQYGAGPQGEPLGYVSEVGEIGTRPIRLDQIDFIDENLASIPELAASGNAGSIQYTWQEQDKFVAFAPIPYYGGEYEYPAGFGWIGIGAEVGGFHLAATQVGEAIAQRVDTLQWGTMIVLLIGGLVSMPVAGMLARSVAQPIQRIIQAAQSVERGETELEMLNPLLKKKSGGEMVTLARVFKQMADQVYMREKKLKQKISQLRIEINEARKSKEVAEVVETEYFQTLQERVKEIRKRKYEIKN